MEKPILYVDLSLQTDKAIDLAYFLRKIKNDGYSTVALDYELVDPRVNVLHVIPRVKLKIKRKFRLKASRF